MIVVPYLKLLVSVYTIKLCNIIGIITWLFFYLVFNLYQNKYKLYIMVH